MQTHPLLHLTPQDDNPPPLRLILECKELKALQVLRP